MKNNRTEPLVYVVAWYVFVEMQGAYIDTAFWYEDRPVRETLLLNYSVPTEVEFPRLSSRMQ